MVAWDLRAVICPSSTVSTGDSIHSSGVTRRAAVMTVDMSSILFTRSVQLLQAQRQAKSSTAAFTDSDRAENGPGHPRTRFPILELKY